MLQSLSIDSPGENGPRVSGDARWTGGLKMIVTLAECDCLRFGCNHLEFVSSLKCWLGGGAFCCGGHECKQAGREAIFPTREERELRGGVTDAFSIAIYATEAGCSTPSAQRFGDVSSLEGGEGAECDAALFSVDEDEHSSRSASREH